MNIYIYGIGTIGSQVGLNLHLALGDRIDLIVTDKDKVERRNLATQIYDQSTVGFPKTAGFATMIYRIKEKWPNNYKDRYQKITSPISNNGEKVLVVDAFDNYESRNLLGGDNIVHLGFSPERIASVLWDDKFQAQQSNRDQEDICDVAEMRYWLQGVTGVMTDTILTWIETGEKRSVVIDKHFKIVEV